jgi:GNAT superfamily N-acetyltransferase
MKICEVIKVDVEIFPEEKQDDRFYALMGPLFANRGIAEEMDGQLYNKPESTWFVAHEDGVAFGCCCFFKEEKRLFFENFWVAPHLRKNGIGKKLFSIRMVEAEKLDLPIRGITRHQDSLKKYLDQGFVVTSKRGRFYWLEKKPETR